MTNIEQKALELVNEVLAEWGVMKNAIEIPKNSDAFARALLRAIERHEAFRQEVSDAVVAFMMDKPGLSGAGITRFIITKPDPLVEVLKDADDMVRAPDAPSYPEAIRAALAKRGLEIREKAE